MFSKTANVSSNLLVSILKCLFTKIDKNLQKLELPFCTYYVRYAPKTDNKLKS